jgi:hypothetical protein
LTIYYALTTSYITDSSVYFDEHEADLRASLPKNIRVGLTLADKKLETSDSANPFAGRFPTSSKPFENEAQKSLGKFAGTGSPLGRRG